MTGNSGAILVDVQNNELAALWSHRPVPLAGNGLVRSGLPHRLKPVFEAGRRRLLLVPHEAGAVGAVGAAVLRKPVAWLRGWCCLLVGVLGVPITVISGV